MEQDTKDGGPAFPCAWCDSASHIKQGRILLCPMHYRISSMRSRARRDNKYVPKREEIEALAECLNCLGCGRLMNWLRSDGASTQVTLQHDRSGTIRLLCLACNTRHAKHPDDSYYDLPKDHKRCPDCETVLPRSAFALDRSRPIGLKSYCRQCSSIRFTAWEKAHVAA